MQSDDSFQITSTPSGPRWLIRLCGEADYSVVRELSAALAAIGLHPGQEVHIDVGDLRFIDVSCMRALIRFAQRAQQVGVTVTVERPDPTFARIYRVMDSGVLQLSPRQNCEPLGQATDPPLKPGSAKWGGARRGPGGSGARS
jgi:anti-anti-sigma factor